MPLSDVQNGTVIPFSFKRLTSKNRNFNHRHNNNNNNNDSNMNNNNKMMILKRSDEGNNNVINNQYNHRVMKKKKLTTSKICSLQDITNTTIHFGNISLKGNTSSKKKLNNNNVGNDFMIHNDNDIDIQKQHIKKRSRKRRCSLGLIGDEKSRSKLKFLKKEITTKNPLKTEEKKVSARMKFFSSSSSSSSSSSNSRNVRKNNKLATLIPLKEQEIETAKQYIIQAKQFAKQKDSSNLKLAIMMYQKARKILPNNGKLTLRITALENRLAMLQPEEEEEEEEVVMEQVVEVEDMEADDDEDENQNEPGEHMNIEGKEAETEVVSNVNVVDGVKDHQDDENIVRRSSSSSMNSNANINNSKNVDNVVSSVKISESKNATKIDTSSYSDMYSKMKKMPKKTLLSAKEYVLKAKKLAKMKDLNHLENALKYYKLAQDSLPIENDKLALRIASLENRISLLKDIRDNNDNDSSSNSSNEEDPDDETEAKYIIVARKTTSPAVDPLARRKKQYTIDTFSPVVDPLIKALKTRETIEDPLVMALKSNVNRISSNEDDTSVSVHNIGKDVTLSTKMDVMATDNYENNNNTNDDAPAMAAIIPEETLTNESDIKKVPKLIQRLKLKFKSKAVNVILDVFSHCSLHEKLVSLQEKTSFENFLKYLDAGQKIVEKYDDTMVRKNRRVHFCTYDLSTITTPAAPPCFEEKRQTASKLASGMQALCRSLASVCITARRIRIESKSSEEVLEALNELINTLLKPSFLPTLGERRIARFYGKKLQNFVVSFDEKNWISPFAEKLSDSLSSILRHHLRCALNKPQGPMRVTNQRLISDLREEFVQMIPDSGSLEFNYDDVAAVTHDALRMYMTGMKLVNDTPQMSDILESLLYGNNGNEGEKRLHLLWDLVESHQFLKSVLGHKFIRDAYMCNVVNKAVEGSWEALQKFGELASRFPNECPQEQVFVQFCTSPDKFLSDLIDMDEMMDELKSQLILADSVLVSTEYSKDFKKINYHQSIANAHFKLPKVVSDMFQNNEEFAKNYLKNSRMHSHDDDEEIVDKLGRVMCTLCNRRTITHIDCSKCQAAFHPSCLPLPPSTNLDDFNYFCTNCYSKSCLKKREDSIMEMFNNVDDEEEQALMLNREIYHQTREYKDNRYF